MQGPGWTTKVSDGEVGLVSNRKALHAGILRQGALMGAAVGKVLGMGRPLGFCHCVSANHE